MTDIIDGPINPDLQAAATAYAENPIRVMFSPQDLFLAVKTLQNLTALSSDKRPFTGIIAIPRGGLIAGTMLSHTLGVTLFADPLLVHLTPEIVHRLLIVDDIADTGHTLNGVITRLYEHMDRLGISGTIEIATLHHKPRSIVRPDFCAHVIPNNFWIDYFWENANAQPTPDYQKTVK